MDGERWGAKGDTDEAQPAGRGVSRRTVLGGGLALGAARVLHIPWAMAASAPATYDPRQRFVRLVGGGIGTIYAVQADGRLLWYRNTGWATVTASWANGGVARPIGTAWAQFHTVMAGADGTIFALRGNGDLLWYRYICTNQQTGAGFWAINSGSVIGRGFNKFPRVLGGYDGVIWGIDGAGDLFWYRYLRKDGLAGVTAWAGGTKVGSGWSDISEVVADTDGVLYGMDKSMRWYRYVDGGAGNRYWARGSGRVIGSGWTVQTQKAALCTGSGAIYRVALDTGPVPDRDDKLVGYRLTNWRTAGSEGATWSSRNRTVVGTGFTVEPTAALQGYSTTLDVRRGSRATFAVSSTFPSFTASVLRLAPGLAAVQVRGPITAAGRLRLLPFDYRSAGCRWPESLALDVPADWPSGLYAVRLVGPHNLGFLVPFTVRPVEPSAPVAVLLPTNTYRAYEIWGGHNQYSVGGGGSRRTMSLLQPYSTVPITSNGRRDHTWYSDQLLLRWMSGQGIGFDVYEDQDLHLSADWLLRYRALVLTTHPEYWTEAMRANLIGWLGAGGRLIYTGGNGIYERVTYDPDHKAVTFRRSDGTRDEYRAAGLPESQIFGVAYDPTTWGSHASFRVLHDSPLFEGTGLAIGDTFGATGYNGAASGWEVDARLGLDGDARAEEVIAEGLHSRRSAMVFKEGPNGGFVFSAGSLTFNGGLSRDPRLSILLRNVFDRAVAPNLEQLAESPATATQRSTIPVKVKGDERATR